MVPHYKQKNKEVHIKHTPELGCNTRMSTYHF